MPGRDRDDRIDDDEVLGPFEGGVEVRGHLGRRETREQRVELALEARWIRARGPPGPYLGLDFGGKLVHVDRLMRHGLLGLPGGISRHESTLEGRTPGRDDRSARPGSSNVRRTPILVHPAGLRKVRSPVRSRFITGCLTLALAVPAATAGVVASVLDATPAGAVTTTAAWSHQTTGWNRSSSPTTGDVNGDHIPEVVFGHQDGRIRVLDGNTGAALPGWPVQTGSAIDSSPAVADLTNDGRMKVIVGLGSTWVRNQQGGVAIYNANGT